MSTFPNSPRILKSGLVLIDPESARVLRIIALQYNPVRSPLFFRFWRREMMRTPAWV